MKHVYSYGAVYRLTDRNYKTLLKAAAKGADYDLNALGKELMTIDLETHHLTAEHAQSRLEVLKTEGMP